LKIYSEGSKKTEKFGKWKTLKIKGKKLKSNEKIRRGKS